MVWLFLWWRWSYMWHTLFFDWNISQIDLSRSLFYKHWSETATKVVICYLLVHGNNEHTNVCWMKLVPNVIIGFKSDFRRKSCDFRIYHLLSSSCYCMKTSYESSIFWCVSISAIEIRYLFFSSIQIQVKLAWIEESAHSSTYFFATRISAEKSTCSKLHENGCKWREEQNGIKLKTVGYFHKFKIVEKEAEPGTSKHTHTEEEYEWEYSGTKMQMRHYFGWLKRVGRIWKKCHFIKQKKNIAPLQFLQVIIITIHFACDDLYSFTWPDNATTDKRNQTKNDQIYPGLYDKKI